MMMIIQIYTDYVFYLRTLPYPSLKLFYGKSSHTLYQKFNSIMPFTYNMNQMRVTLLLLFVFAIVTLHGRSRLTKGKSKEYDVVIVGGGFSGLYVAMRLGQSHNGNLKIAIVEANESDNNHDETGFSRNGISEISSYENHACLGGKIEDIPYKCDIDKKNNPYCPSKGIFAGNVWFGFHAMRYKTTHGNFFLAKELGFQDIHPNPNHKYGEAEGKMGHDRGFYFYGHDRGQYLLDNKYQDDYLYKNLISNKFEDIFNAQFEDENINKLCNENINNEWLSLRDYIANITGSSMGFELLEGESRFKGEYWHLDAQGMVEFRDSDLNSEQGFAVYPTGGMSEFIRRFYKQIIDNNYADIYCGFHVSKIEKHKKKQKYKIVNNNEYLYGDK
eukprot:241964_1